MISDINSIPISSDNSVEFQKIKFNKDNNLDNLTMIIINKRKDIEIEKNIENKSEIIDNKGNNSSKKEKSSLKNKISKEKRHRTNYQSEREFLKINDNNNNHKINISTKNKKINRFINLVKDSFNKKLTTSDKESASSSKKINIKINEICLICNEELKDEEIKNNNLECHHLFCDSCYYDYIKLKITRNEIDSIKCPQYNCNIKLYNNFIEKKLINDIPLLDKYKTLQRRRELMLNPKVQLCPFPDCESYAIKENGQNKYVTCIKNHHKFCFNCLKDWHNEKPCDTKVDNSFEKWRDSLRVRRCPKCKMFIEKNEGCNHIKCTNCEYEFCWLCMNEYTKNHYSFGRCSGLRYINCIFCYNRLFNLFYQFILVIGKSILFIICCPLLVIFYICYFVLHNCYPKDDDEILFLGSIFCTLTFLNFIICLFPISAIISILMIFYWPLQDKIFTFIIKRI